MYVRNTQQFSYICTCIHTYIHVSAKKNSGWLYVEMRAHTHAYMHLKNIACLHAHKHACICTIHIHFNDVFTYMLAYVRIYERVYELYNYIHMYVYMNYVNIYVYAYTYMHTHAPIKRYDFGFTPFDLDHCKTEP